MEIFKSKDYLIDYIVKDRNRTFIIDKDELFIALLDIKKQRWGNRNNHGWKARN